MPVRWGWLAPLIAFLLGGAVLAEPMETSLVYRGVVQDRGGLPIPGARVRFWWVQDRFDYWKFPETSPNSEAVTDYNGVFALFTQAPAGAALSFLETRHPDYGLVLTESSAMSRIVCPTGTPAGDLPPLPSGSPPRITLPPRATVTGIVVSAQGTPVADARVSPRILIVPPPDRPGKPPRMLQISSELTPILSTTTGADGHFSLDGMPADTPIGIRAWHPDVGRGLDPGSIDAPRWKPLQLTAADSPITVTLSEPVTFKGEVRLAAGTEFGGKIQIRAEYDGIAGVPHRILDVDPNGVFSSCPVLAGTYVLHVLAPPLVAPFARIYTSEGLTVPPIVLGRGATLAGRVVDAATGDLVPDAHLTMSLTAPMESTTSVELVARGGRFAFTTRPGRVEVSITGENCTVDESSGKWQLLLDHGLELEDLEIKVHPFRAITGDVLFPDGSPAVDVPVRASFKYQTRTGANGQFTLMVPVTKLENPLVLGAEMEGAQPLMGTAEVVDSGGYIPPATIQLAEPCTVTGTVLDDQYSPVGGALVSGASLQFQPIDVITDSAGRFRLYPMAANTMAYLYPFEGETTTVRPMAPGETREIGSLTVRRQSWQTVGGVSEAYMRALAP